MYYDKETWVMFNQPENEFYTRSLFKIDVLPHDVELPLDIAANFFNKLSPNVRELVISERVQVNPRPPSETNHQGNQSLLLVRNAAVEA